MDVDCKFVVYVLRSLRDGKRYIGMTENIQRRLNEHNTGKVCSTKSRVPFVLLHHEEFKTRREVHRREEYFKTAVGRKYLDRCEIK